MADTNILSMRFNQDNSLFSVAMENGFRIYCTEPLADKGRFTQEQVGSVAQVEMLHRTNVLAVISGGQKPKYSDKTVQMYDDLGADGKAVQKYEFYADKPILAFKMRKEKAVAVVRDEVHVFSFEAGYDYSKPKLFMTIATRDNPLGLVALSSAIDKPLLVFPGQQEGSIQLMDLSSVGEDRSSAPIAIKAHKGEIACIALNQQATLVATASVTGTLIRVFDVVQKRQVVELRRGADPATVYCINFSPDSAFLCTSSDKGTVHIFAVKDTALNKRSSFKTMPFLGQYVESQWGLANFTVAAECACICAFGRVADPEENAATAVDKNRYSVIAICVDGTFHKYVFTPEGSCHRESYDVFLDIDDDMNF